MIDYTTILSTYQSLIGYEQRRNPNYAIISGTDLVNETDSINSVSPEILKTETLSDVFDNFEKFQYNVWDIATAYGVGEVVLYDGNEYVNILAGTGAQPDITPLSWTFVQAQPTFSNLLQTYKDRGIKDAFRDIFEYRTNRDVKQLMNVTALYEAGGYRDNNGDFRLETKKGFHGFRFDSFLIENQVAELNKIGLHFTGVESFTLYVFHESGDAPIYTQAINYTTPNEWEWIDLSNMILKHTTDNQSSGGAYYVGYFASEISNDIIQSDWASVSGAWCTNCYWGISSARYQRAYSKFVEAQPISFDTNKLNGTNKPYGLGDFEGNPAGMNLSIKVYNDPSYMVTQCASVFTELIKQKTAIILLAAMKNNSRLNRIAEISKDLIIRELEGYENENIKGLYDMYKEKLKEVSNNLNNVGGWCDARMLPKNL
jgi:hypothetical protein